MRGFGLKLVDLKKAIGTVVMALVGFDDFKNAIGTLMMSCIGYKSGCGQYMLHTPKYTHATLLYLSACSMGQL
jgi:hypothetical protein